LALTLADHQIQHDNLYAQGIVKIFEEENPVMRYLPFNKVNGDGQRIRVEEGLPGIEWRRVNQNYAESTGTLGTRMEPLYLLGGDMFIDNFILRTAGTGSGTFDHERVQFEMKARAMSREISRAFFEGDDLVDPDEMPGLRRRLAGASVQVAGANGAPLTLAMMDALIDRTLPGNVHIFMNKTLRRFLTSLITVPGTNAAWRLTYDSVNDAGGQVMRYNGVPVHVVEDRGNEQTILGFDEVCGTSSVTSSIY
jgi:Major capsid protein GP7